MSGRPKGVTQAQYREIAREQSLLDFEAFCNEQQGRVRNSLRLNEPARLNSAQLKRQAIITRKGLDVGGAGMPWRTGD